MNVKHVHFKLNDVPKKIEDMFKLKVVFKQEDHLIKHGHVLIYSILKIAQPADHVLGLCIKKCIKYMSMSMDDK